MATPSVFTLDLDLDLFAGPFDLLLALILREEVDLAEVALAEDAALDLEASTEFLVLVAGICELKSRLLLPGEELDDLMDDEDAAGELAARLAEYARVQAAARWLADRRIEVGRRVFRTGPAPLASRRPVDRPLPEEDPLALRAAIGRLLEPPPTPDLSHMPRRLVPIRDFLDRFRRLLDERGTFHFDDAVVGLDRMAQAVAFWALLDLYKRGEVRLAQLEPFAPIRIARSSRIAVGDEAVA